MDIKLFEWKSNYNSINWISTKPNNCICNMIINGLLFILYIKMKLPQSQLSKVKVMVLQLSQRQKIFRLRKKGNTMRQRGRSRTTGRYGEWGSHSHKGERARRLWVFASVTKSIRSCPCKEIQYNVQCGLYGIYKFNRTLSFAISKKWTRTFVSGTVVWRTPLVRVFSWEWCNVLFQLQTFHEWWKV